MPVYLMQTGDDRIIVEAKSAASARLYLSYQKTNVSTIGATDIAMLVMDGVCVERASKDAEATDERR